MNPLRLPATINEIEIADHFTLNEFECPCCRRVMLDSRILNFLIDVRNKYGNAIIISSGYRCMFQNLRVDGNPYSKHLIGLAVDIVPMLDEFLEELHGICLQQNTEMLIILHDQKRYIHIEVR